MQHSLERRANSCCGVIDTVGNRVKLDEYLGDVNAEDILRDVLGDILGDVLGDLLGDIRGDVLGDNLGDLLGDSFGDSPGENLRELLGDKFGDRLADTDGLCILYCQDVAPSIIIETKYMQYIE